MNVLVLNCGTSSDLSFSGFYDYDLDLRIGNQILNFSEIFFA